MVAELKILAFTDFHGNSKAHERATQIVESERPDLVVVAGDIVNHDPDSARQLLTDLAAAGRPIYFVPGNMDNIALSSWHGNINVHCLHGRCEYYGDVALIGLGGSPPGPFSTPFELSDEQAKLLIDKALESYRGGSLILVSHTPPIDSKIDLVSEVGHIGSRVARGFVEHLRPVLVLSGHVHEAQGIDMIGSTTLVNTGPAERGSFARATIDNGRVKVSFGRLF